MNDKLLASALSLQPEHITSKHGYTFSFTLKLTTILLQKLTFYVWNVKQKYDGKDQNTLYWYYGAYVATNKQI